MLMCAHVWTHTYTHTHPYTHTPCQFPLPCHPPLPSAWNAPHTSSQILLFLQTLGTSPWLPQPTTDLLFEFLSEHCSAIPWLIAWSEFLLLCVQPTTASEALQDLVPVWLVTSSPTTSHTFCSVCFSLMGCLSSLKMLHACFCSEPYACYPLPSNLGMNDNCSSLTLNLNVTPRSLTTLPKRLIFHSHRTLSHSF